jgi:two-component system, chemotaxis family, chemotaxis protein CheY
MAPVTGEGSAPGRGTESWILVIDDDEDIREALVDVLGDAGYSVRVAASGSDALELLRGVEPPSLILLDLMMPGMDGFAFRAAQVADPRIASIPVVIVSAGGNLATDAKRLGATGFIQKPMRLDAILREVGSRCA